MASIAILGATGHIGTSLLFYFLNDPEYQISCYTRSMDKLGAFLSGFINGYTVRSFDDVDNILRSDYDVVLNCIGVGKPSLLPKVAPEIFSLTERFDNLIIGYLDKHPDTLYINFSSGAVYGTEFSSPVDSESMASIPINAVTPAHYYRTAKLNSEIKHRAFAKKRIVDLRVFNYFSRFIDLTSGYLMTELVNCCRSHQPFVTGTNDIVRDFVHPADLFQAVVACVRSPDRNTAYDLYSKAPVTKWGLVRLFKSHYDLEVQTVEHSVPSLTGAKSNYYSLDRRLSGIGYSPALSSIEAVAAELSFVMKTPNPDHTVRP